MSTADQARVFLAMMLCGACTGMMHDLLSVIRRGWLLTAIADILLALFCAAGVIGAGLLLGCDPFRLFSFSGVCLGWTVYAISLGTIVRVLMESFIKLSKKVTNKAKKAKMMQENEKKQRI